MKSRRLKGAPSLNCLDLQKAIDNLCETTFPNSTRAKSARIYFYRTRLNMEVKQVAAIFELDPYFVNCVAYKVGREKDDKIKQLEEAIKFRFWKYHRDRYVNHARQIVARMDRFKTA